MNTHAHGEPLLSVCELEVQIAGRRLVDALTFAAHAGEFIAVLGENGVGKTLTLHTLAGLRPPAGGRIEVQGKDLLAWPRRALARVLGLLAQSSEDPFPSTVLETALIGRHPHIELWQWENEQDFSTARGALADVDLADREERTVDTLSGGERRRLAIATVLTQEPRLYLLDEPTNHLDPHHQLGILQLFRSRADQGASVIATLHDATLAARFADQVLLLFGGGAWVFGPSAAVLDAAHLTRLYHTPIHELGFHGRRVFVSD
ncbi:MAG TPA: ABC transporter ATP-binding protein [Steroidobacteraceae bacterium]|nr:ABC transporter ATP-binding protein [Steroidobacteraceae bacterium]